MIRRTVKRGQESAQEYIQKYISRCPVCKDPEPGWKFSHVEFLQDRKIQYKCGCCGCILETGYEDLRGIRGNGITDFLKGAAGYDAMVRSVYRKKKGVIYVRILASGNQKKARNLEGKELTLEELKEMFWE